MGLALVPRPIQLIDLALGSGFGSIRPSPCSQGVACSSRATAARWWCWRRAN